MISKCLNLVDSFLGEFDILLVQFRAVGPSEHLDKSNVSHLVVFLSFVREHCLEDVTGGAFDNELLFVHVSLYFVMNRGSRGRVELRHNLLIEVGLSAENELATLDLLEELQTPLVKKMVLGTLLPIRDHELFSFLKWLQLFRASFLFCNNGLVSKSLNWWLIFLESNR